MGAMTVGRLYLCLRCILSLFHDDCASLHAGGSPRNAWRPDLAVNGLVAGVIAGAFGMAYFVYGKRQSKVVPLVAGVLLCIYPYFIENPYALFGIGAALLAAPFLVDF
jgi:hypothetical protein